MSHESAYDIAQTLSKFYAVVTVSHVDTVADLQALVNRKPDLVFAGIYHVTDSRNGAKVWLADELEKHGIRYTGSGKDANRLSLNKHLAKQRMLESDINTPAFLLSRRDDSHPITEEELTFPLFVKPTNKSGGQGVDEFSIVRSSQDLQKKVLSIHTTHRTDALVEEYLSGREFSIGIIGDESGCIGMPLELVADQDSNGDRIRSRAIKTADAEAMNVITDLSERRLIGDFAVDAFQALGGRGYGRIDVRCNDSGVPYFLEANHIPSLMQIDSSFLRSYEEATGNSYDDMILQIVRLGLERNTAKDALEELRLVA